MEKYFCTFKMPTSPAPSMVSFESEHTGTAILKMMSIAGITNTMELEQCEILKFVRTDKGQPGYVSVFLKEPGDKKGRIALVKDQPPPFFDAAAVDKQLADAPPADVYKRPYTIEVL